jgi:hypothetical protein
MSDATVGVTAKFLHPYEGLHVSAKIIPPSTFELAEGNARIRGQYNNRLLKAYNDATKSEEVAIERPVEATTRYPGTDNCCK